MLRNFVNMWLLVAALALAGCSSNPLAPVDLPDDVRAVTVPFLAALKAGDRAKASNYVDRYFLDDTMEAFEPARADLEASPPLVPVAFVQKQGALGVDENDVTVIYAARNGKDWVTARMRLGRTKGEAFKIEFWSVVYGPDTPKFVTAANEFRWFMYGLMATMMVGGLVLLALLLWFVKRKAHLIGPQPLPERRESAVTTRDPAD